MTPYSLLLSTLLVAAHLEYVAHAQTILGKDVYWNGPYYFVGCEPDQGAALKALFKQIGISLTNDIIPDAELGSKSKYGFKTWFSTNSASVVSDVYRDIVDADVQSTVSGRAVQKPSFVCVNNDNPELNPDLNPLLDPAFRQALNLCSKGYIALTGTSTNYVLLCPRYFDADHGDYPTHSDCPAVNGRETAFTNSNSAWRGQLKINYNRQSTIIHELVHKYQPRLGTKEVYGINQCIRLSAVDQLNNPNNYAFHSASVVAQCTQFPGGESSLRRSRSRRQTAASDSSGSPVDGSTSGANATDLTVDDGESLWYDDDADFGDALNSALANATVILKSLDPSGQDSTVAATA